MTVISLLDSPLIRAVRDDGAEHALTLPGLLAALTRDDVAFLPAVQAHQRHPFHATLVQLAAIAMHASGTSESPVDEESWTQLLLGVVPEAHRETAYALVAPLDRPAFLQPAVTAARRDTPVRESCPRSIDVPIITRSHDVKIGSASLGRPDDWLAALVSVQTCQGRTDRFHMGIARINGSLGNRVGVGLVPPGGLGAQFVRDLHGHLFHRERLVREVGYAGRGGIALSWLEPWDVDESLPLAGMDPYFVESGRRIRLAQGADGQLSALVWQNMVYRVAAEAFNGDVGDLWVPRVIEPEKTKSFSGDKTGFGYKRMTSLLFGVTGEAQTTVPSPLSMPLPSDPRQGMRFRARMLVRGQGKTQGYHERTVPVAQSYATLLGRPEGEPYGLMAREMVQSAGTATGALSTALKKLVTGLAAPRPGDKSTKAKAARLLAPMTASIDAMFFDALAGFGDRIAAGETRESCLLEWQVALYRMGLSALEAAQGAPGGILVRREAAIARSSSAYRGIYRKNFRAAWEAMYPPDSVEDADARADAEAQGDVGADVDEPEEEMAGGDDE